LTGVANPFWRVMVPDRAGDTDGCRSRWIPSCHSLSEEFSGKHPVARARHSSGAEPYGADGDYVRFSIKQF
jgi:hypothetical protein